MHLLVCFYKVLLVEVFSFSFLGFLKMVYEEERESKSSRNMKGTVAE